MVPTGDKTIRRCFPGTVKFAWVKIRMSEAHVKSDGCGGRRVWSAYRACNEQPVACSAGFATQTVDVPNVPPNSRMLYSIRPHNTGNKQGRIGADCDVRLVTCGDPGIAWDVQSAEVCQALSWVKAAAGRLRPGRARPDPPASSLWASPPVYSWPRRPACPSVSWSMWRAGAV